MYITIKMFFVIFLLTIFFALYADWTNNHPLVLVQPDGTELHVLVSGDEFHNWAHNENLFTMVQDDQTGFWCWAKEEQGNVVSSGFPVHLYSPESLGLQPSINISESQYQDKRLARDSDFSLRNTRQTPSTGNALNLVVFIKFLGDPGFMDNFIYYRNMFLNEGVNVNSLYQYYNDASYGTLQVITEFFPLQTEGIVIAYEDIEPRSYFMPYNANGNPNGYTDDSQSGIREQQMLSRAIAFVQTQIDPNYVVDNNGDGTVDCVNFIISGTSGAWASLLWPHAWSMYYATATLNGKNVERYNFNMEDRTKSDGVSVLAHEFGHALGLPDLYRYSYNGTPIGSWCLMASNAKPPQSISARMKARFPGWSGPMRVIETSGYYTLEPVTTSQYNNCYRINSPNSTMEHFVVEYRSNATGLTDSSLPGQGLLVYRVNTSRDGNAQGPPDELYVYRSGGSYAFPDGIVGNAFYSEQHGKTEINDYTDPSSFLTNGSGGGLSIHSIGLSGDSISFYVDLDGADPNYYTESFESQTFLHNDWINMGDSPWIIDNSAAFEGQYSASAPNEVSSQYSPLTLNLVVDRGYIQFWLKTQTVSNQGYLRFYLDEQLIKSWTGDNDWLFFFVPINAGQHQFQWVYENNNSSPSPNNQVWIDQVGFPNISGVVLYPPKDLTYSIQDRNITFQWEVPYTTVYPEKPTILGYYIYQLDNNQVNSQPLENQSFTLVNSSGGQLTFYVKAIYEAGLSDASNNIEVNIQPLGFPINLTATQEGNIVHLKWDFPYSSFNNVGFRVHRNGIFIGTVLTSTGLLEYWDRNIEAYNSYIYQVNAVYGNPAGSSGLSNEAFIDVVSGSDLISQKVKTELLNNYPNPFNPETIISFNLKEKYHVLLEVFNIKGELVRTLANREFNQGKSSVIWNGKDDNGKDAASGIYFYRLLTVDYISVKKMIFLK